MLCSTHCVHNPLHCQLTIKSPQSTVEVEMCCKCVLEGSSRLVVFDTERTFDWRFLCCSWDSKESLINRLKRTRGLINVERKWKIRWRRAVKMTESESGELVVCSNFESQWSSDKRGLTWSFVSFWITFLAGLFWIFWRQRSSSDGKPARTEWQSTRRLKMSDEKCWTVAPWERNDLTGASFLSYL